MEPWLAAVLASVVAFLLYLGLSANEIQSLSRF